MWEQVFKYMFLSSGVIYMILRTSRNKKLFKIAGHIYNIVLIVYVFILLMK